MVAKYLYDAWGNCTISSESTNTAVAAANPIRYRGYYYDDDTGLYYCNARYYSPKWHRFISPDDTAYLTPESVNGLNLYCYCNNDPVNYADPSGHFLISTAVLIGAIVGAAIGATVGGVVAYNVAKDHGAEGWELFWWTLVGVVGGGIIGGAVGAAMGYGVGYLAGGTYANGLSVKAVNKGLKTFLSQSNKVHHAFTNPAHKFTGYTVRSFNKLVRNTMAKGVVGQYKSVLSSYWSAANSEVSFTIINSAIMISDAWIR